MKVHIGILLLFVAAGAGLWLADAALDAVFVYPSFADSLTAEPYELIMRCLASLVVVALGAVVSWQAAKRKRDQQRLEHLNAVLGAIRNVTQLIVRETDEAKLIQGVCENLVETRRYHNAWIALIDGPGGAVLTAEAGLGERFAPMAERLRRGEPARCGRMALDEPGVVVIEDPPSECADCPLAAGYAGRAAMTVRLEHAGKVCGVLSVSTPPDMARGEEEQRLFSEVAGDVALALHGIDAEEKRKQAEQERERLIAELEQKNAELERFAYTVSHDLKGPLITIKGFAGLLPKGIAEGTMEQVHEDLRRISGAADRMHQLLDELLDLSRIGRVVGPPEDVPLSDLAREALELMALRVGENGIEVHVPPDLPVVHGHRPRLLSVMQNLMDNAVKFMGDQPEPRVEIGAHHEGDETLCWVRDNGIGIDPKYHDRVFGLFDQLHRGTSEGTGIGLAIAKRVVEVHGGRIWVESKGKGHGSTFCFALPRKGESANGEDQ